MSKGPADWHAADEEVVTESPVVSSKRGVELTTLDFKLEKDVTLALPDDVLILLFAQASSDPRKIVPCLLVCKRWYSVTMEATFLWTNINSKWWRATPILLERSKDALLSVTWTVEDEPAGEFYTKFSDCLPRVFIEADRIESIDLSIDNLTWPRLHPQFQQPFASLRSASFISTDEPGPLLNSVDFKIPIAGLLRSLTLSDVDSKNMTEACFPLLESFSLRERLELRLGDILAFLSKTPLLKNLELSCVQLETTMETDLDRSMETVSLPNLELLNILAVHDVASINQILRHLDVPKSSAFDLTFFEGFGENSEVSPDYGDVFLSLLPYSARTIRPLKLHLEAYAKGYLMVTSSMDLHPENPCRKLEIGLGTPLPDHAPRDAMERKEGYLVGLDALVDLSMLREFKVGTDLSKDAWSRLIPSFMALESIEITLTGVEALMSGLIETASIYGPTPPTSRFAKLCVISEADDTGSAWFHPLSSIIEGLTCRAQIANIALLDRLEIRAPVASGGEDTFQDSFEEDDETLQERLDSLRILVGTIYFKGHAKKTFGFELPEYIQSLDS